LPHFISSFYHLTSQEGQLQYNKIFREREHMREVGGGARGRERKGSQAASALIEEPDVGLDLTTPRS